MTWPRASLDGGNRDVIPALDFRDPTPRLGGFRVADSVDVPLAFWAQSRRITLLVHGFATPEHAASDEYVRFRRQLKRYGRITGAIGAVYWPGDHWFQALGKALFPLRIETAETTAQRLFQVIRRLPAEEIVLVGHSLGCRVVLETLRLLKASGQSRPRILVTYLMAAAVPVSDCRDEACYSRANTTPGEQIAAFSNNDLVLKYSFRTGMAAARPRNAIRHGWGDGRAVGRAGEPTPRWSATVRSINGHGDYWPSRYIAYRLMRATRDAEIRIPERNRIASSRIETHKASVRSRRDKRSSS